MRCSLARDCVCREQVIRSISDQRPVSSHSPVPLASSATCINHGKQRSPSSRTPEQHPRISASPMAHALRTSSCAPGIACRLGATQRRAKEYEPSYQNPADCHGAADRRRCSGVCATGDTTGRARGKRARMVMPGEFTGGVALTNNYILCITQSDDDPAIRGSLNYTLIPASLAPASMAAYGDLTSTSATATALTSSWTGTFGIGGEISTVA